MKFSKIIDRAVKIIKNEGVIVYPTETVFGLGADATNAKAVGKVYNIKGRDYKKPISIAVSNVKEAKRLVYWNKYAEVLSKKFMPGPLTIILKTKKPFPKKLVAGKNKIGIRIPDHKVALEIIKRVRKPITATSANISGDEEPVDYSKVKNSMKNKVDLIIPCSIKYGKPSTVVDLTKKPKVLRIGIIDKDLIEDAIAGVAKSGQRRRKKK